MKTRLPLALLVSALAVAVRAQAPYVGAAEADREFDRITAEDLRTIASKKALIVSRSFGQNLLDGLDRVAARKPGFKVAYARNLANLHMGDPMSKVPADVFEKNSIAHVLITIEPLDKRIDQAAELLRHPPWEFGKKADVVMVEYHGSKPEFFPTYQKKMDALAREFPNIRFIYVTSGLMPRENDPGNEASWAFGELVLKHYKGKVPILDWRDLLSTRPDGTPVGHQMVPEFNAYPRGNPDRTHPNSDFAEERLGRAWWVLMYKLFCAPAP